MQITQTTVALEIVQTPGDSRLQQLFTCIYRLFQQSFLSWILSRYTNNADKDSLKEDAKDAFQNGLLAFYFKAQDKKFSIKGSLKTTLYSFGFLQLLAFFKTKKKHEHKPLHELELFFENEFFEAERKEWLSEKEADVIKALASLPKKMRDILMMKFFEKLKSKEIAERLHISVGNVDNNTAKAYKLLRESLTLNPVTQK